jgi:pimeloyl-ACP methyl ester carboxylesterase
MAVSTSAVTINAHKIFYRESGGGNTGAGRRQAVIFIHGNSFSSRAFLKQLESGLAESYRLIAPDLPGHGDSFRSGNPGVDYTLRGHAETLAAFARSVDAEDAVFAGWSLGGHILLEASDLLPRAEGFLIFGTPPVGALPAGAAALLFRTDLTGPEREEVLNATFNPGYGGIPELFREDHRRTDPMVRSVMGEVVAAGNARDEIEIAGALKTPLAVVHGERDQLINLEYLQSLRYTNLYRNEIIVIPGAGHAVQWEAPDRFNKILKTFIDSSACSAE